jgi:hypothetical protein
MKKKRQISMLSVILFILLLFVSTGCNNAWEQKNFIEHWKKVRTAVVEKDLEAFKNLTISEDPEKFTKMPQKDFEEFAEMWLIPSFPEWNTVKLVKFEQTDKKALLVLHLHDDNDEWKEWIVLSAYTFLLTEDGWKMSTAFSESQFSKSESAETNQKNIEEKLKEDPELQLETM